MKIAIGLRKAELLLATSQTLREKHQNDSKRKLVSPIPGTDYSVEVWEPGSYYKKRRIYGFDADGKAIIVIESHDDRPMIGPILAACRNSQPWHWFMKDKWIPVGTYPPTTDDYDPPEYSDLFQNGNGQGGNQGHIPNAWARTKSNGNKVFVWDVLWEAGVDDLSFSIAGAGSPAESQELEEQLREIERVVDDLEEPQPDQNSPDPFE